MKQRRLSETTDLAAFLAECREEAITRRRFLQTLAGGTIAAMFPWSAQADQKAADLDEAMQWKLLDVVLQQLLPSEADSPGAKEIDALNYFRFIVSDTLIDADEREFIMQGTIWLEDMSRNTMQLGSFMALDEAKREQVLRRIEQSRAGENWLSTLLVYLMEALLADPVYGGNANEGGWKWLQHIPGFPRPPADKRYPELLKL